MCFLVPYLCSVSRPARDRQALSGVRNHAMPGQRPSRPGLSPGPARTASPASRATRPVSSAGAHSVSGTAGGSDPLGTGRGDRGIATVVGPGARRRRAPPFGEVVPGQFGGLGAASEVRLGGRAGARAVGVGGLLGRGCRGSVARRPRSRAHHRSPQSPTACGYPASGPDREPSGRSAGTVLRDGLARTPRTPARRATWWRWVGARVRLSQRLRHPAGASGRPLLRGPVRHGQPCPVVRG